MVVVVVVVVEVVKGSGGGERECEGRLVLEGVDAVFCWAKPALNTVVANLKWQF